MHILLIKLHNLKRKLQIFLKRMKNMMKRNRVKIKLKGILKTMEKNNWRLLKIFNK